LANIQELQKLDLSATGIGNAGIRYLVGLKEKRARPLKLQDLSLRFNEELTEESLSLLAARMPTLEALDIRHCQLDKNDAKETFRLLKQNGTKVEGGV
jgi:Ran GTPase-activating protein (RanGAP) involved in mRNA processing and transport